MKKNMGGMDRAIRVVAALIIGVLYLSGSISGTPAFVLLAVALIFLATSTMSFCPLYTLFGFSTCKVEENAK